MPSHDCHTFPWLGGSGAETRLQFTLQLSRILDQEAEQTQTGCYIHVVQTWRGACLAAREFEEGEVATGRKLVVHEHADSYSSPDGEEVVNGGAWELLQCWADSQQLPSY